MCKISIINLIRIKRVCRFRRTNAFVLGTALVVGLPAKGNKFKAFAAKLSRRIAKIKYLALPLIKQIIPEDG